MRERESHNRLMSHGDVYIYIYIHPPRRQWGFDRRHSSWAFKLGIRAGSAHRYGC